MLKLIFLQEVDHNRIGDILRVRRKEKRYIESINPPLDPFETIRLWLWLFGPSLPLRLKERVRNDGDVCNLQMGLKFYSKLILDQWEVCMVLILIQKSMKRYPPQSIRALFL